MVALNDAVIDFESLESSKVDLEYESSHRFLTLYELSFIFSFLLFTMLINFSKLEKKENFLIYFILFYFILFI